jgi:hypothetical protein
LKRFVFAAAAVLAVAALALAQEPLGEESLRPYWIFTVEILVPEADAEAAAAEPAEGKRKMMRFLLGARVEYLGDWGGGIQARLYLIEYLPLKASIESPQGEDMDGDAVLTFFPIPLPALVSPSPLRPVLPNALGGAGGYYTQIDKDAIEAWDSETERSYYIHRPSDAEIDLGKSIVFSADFRDQPSVDNIQPEDEEWRYLNITGGINFRF